MKKVISLALAVILALSLTTVSFAAALTAVAEPGEKYTIDAASFYLSGTSGDKLGLKASGTATGLKPGQLIIDADDGTGTHNYFTSDYFNLTYKIDKGGEKLEYIKLKDGLVEIKFKANYSLEAPSIANFGLKELKVKAIKDIKGTIADSATVTTDNAIIYAAADTTKAGISKSEEFYADLAVLGGITVGYDKKDSAGSTGDVLLNKNTAVKLTSGAYRVFKKDSAAGGVDFKDITYVEGDVYLEVRVFDGDKLYIGVDSSADLDIVKANPDAELSFYRFKGEPTFSASAKIEISADKDQFVYALKDGKLVKANLKWNDEAYAFTGKAVTLGSYVVSDIELKNAASADEKDDTKNPNTGANDVVGVAVALAVVSLVAAGAVSLKK